jgi:hypothetical protein
MLMLGKDDSIEPFMSFLYLLCAKSGAVAQSPKDATYKSHRRGQKHINGALKYLFSVETANRPI